MTRASARNWASYGKDVDLGALGDAERLAIAPLLDGTQSLQQRLRTAADGSTVREYATVYRGGYGNDVQGVLQLGIADAPLTQALYSAMFYIAALLFLLLEELPIHTPLVYIILK